MRKSVGFLTASGFLSAILLVWGQLWITSRTGSAFDWASSLGLLWTYTAVLLSLIASVIAIYNDLKTAEAQVPIAAMYLLGMAFGMAFVDIGQSVCSNLLFIMANAPSIPDWLLRYASYEHVKLGFYIAAPIVLLVIFPIVRFFINRIRKSQGKVPQSILIVKENTSPMIETKESSKPIENNPEEASN